MNFRTNLALKPEYNQVDYNSEILLIGSCFSENINKKLEYYKFKTFSNPFGILFNPKAIENLITNALNLKTYTEKDIFQLNERWHCFDAHSDLSNSNKNELLSNLNNAINSTNKQLKEASHLIITLGTSWVYKHIETETFVGNCHKIPQKQFLKKLLSVEEITTSLNAICTLVKNINSKINIVFTVSPVRHLKDGFVENMQSKAHLISAIHQIIDRRKQDFDSVQTSKLFYFPSYEIMMDDLRDYRFYNSDMLHPNETAINYIWEQFQQVWIDNNTASIQKEIDTIQKGLAHKPFNPTSEQHQLFLKKLHKKIANLEKRLAIKF
ncbi:GSCFA domain-containing protein [Lutibacter sp. A64]|uniref:GSCFA domain-containing protein n=1 Tax=Lutibacter sp. A64 TaxID=2918526 RepID=UPI001F0699A9|nr:GSCFA domain-containing protein [Lutibacter sp. A64]UMB53239.1 GSCFA domain-containing protein [Lutibacter sp. A64]